MRLSDSYDNLHAVLTLDKNNYTVKTTQQKILERDLKSRYINAIKQRRPFYR